MQRREISSTPVWPYIAVVTLLFAFSVWASHLWRSAQSPRIEAPAWVGIQKTFVSDPIPASDIDPGVVVQLPEVDPSDLLDPMEEDAISGIVALDEFQAPRQQAIVAPPVADQMAPDISVVEMPALPNPDQATTSLSELQSAPLDPVVKPEVMPLPQVGRTPIQWLPEVASVWPYPTSLLEEMEDLARNAVAHQWAEKVIHHFEQLHRATVFCSPDVRARLEALRELSDNAQRWAVRVGSNQTRSRVLRASYAVRRRAETWMHVYDIIANGEHLQPVTITDMSTVTAHLEAIAKRLEGSQHADSWRQYLKLDELRMAARSADADERCQLARQVLHRTEASYLTLEQRDVLEAPPFQGLKATLRRWANEPVDYSRLLEDLEAYELIQSSIMATRLASDIQLVHWSSCPEVIRLAETLDSHYRNANLRMTISETLINRLLPKEYEFEAELNDYLFGAHVTGQSQAVTHLHVDLIPDHEKWRLGMRATGVAESDTTATKGPARFYNTGLSQYLADKSIVVDCHGVSTECARTEATSQIALRRYETDFDYVPVLGWIARSLALQQHDSLYEEARLETDAKLEMMANDRIDREVQQQVDKVRESFYERWLVPLRHLKLEPHALDMATTDEDLIVRYRLAAPDQLAAFTPRPRAPEGSLVSAQIHESALANTLEQLKLNGRRDDLRTLYRELTETFQRPDLEVPDDVPENVTIQFADRDAVQLRCDRGRVTITLRIAELKRKRRKPWRHFAVRAYYVPDSTQLDANLIREGYIELAGLRLNTFDQIALRAIFSRVLSDDRPFNIINKQLSRHPALADLQVTQFVINDGWIGISLGAHSNGRVVRRLSDRNSYTR